MPHRDYSQNIGTSQFRATAGPAAPQPPTTAASYTAEDRFQHSRGAISTFSRCGADARKGEDISTSATARAALLLEMANRLLPLTDSQKRHKPDAKDSKVAAVGEKDSKYEDLEQMLRHVLKQSF